MISVRLSTPQSIVIIPTGAGEPQILKTPQIVSFGEASWLPGGKEIAYLGTAQGAGHPVGLYIQSVAEGLPRLVAVGLSAGSFAYRLVAPDGKTAITPDANGVLTIVPLDGGPQKPVAGVDVGDHPMHWSPDGKYFYFVRSKPPRAQVMKLELATGRVDLWKEIGPADPAGIVDIYAVHIADDRRSYYYSYTRILNDLYMVGGLK